MFVPGPRSRLPPPAPLARRDYPARPPLLPHRSPKKSSKRLPRAGAMGTLRPWQPEVAAHNPAVLHQLRQDVLGHVDRRGEADTLRREDDGRVDADDLAATVRQRTAAVAGVEGGVGLDDVVHQVPGQAAQRRPRALITPAVTVHSKPNGLPIATTSWPTRSRVESPKGHTAGAPPGPGPLPGRSTGRRRRPCRRAHGRRQAVRAPVHGRGRT